MPEIETKVSMPSMTLGMGASIKNVTPSLEAQPHVEETTSIAQKNTVTETQPETAQAVTREDVEETGFVSGAAKARKLGESRRKLAQSILDSTTTSEEARNNFKKLVSEDKELDKYFRKHFPVKYQSAISELEKSSPSENPDVELSTRAKILVEDLQSDKDDAVIDLAVQLKFTQEEADELKDMALKLEGTKVGGKELDFETALKRAARIIRPDKAKVGITSLPSSKGLDNTQVVLSQAKNEQLVDQSRSITGYAPDRNKMLKNLQVVDQGYNPKTGSFVMPGF